MEAEAALAGDDVGGGGGDRVHDGGVGQPGEPGAGALLRARDEAGGLAVGDDGVGVVAVEVVAEAMEAEPFGVVDDSHQRAL